MNLARFMKLPHRAPALLPALFITLLICPSAARSQPFPSPPPPKRVEQTTGLISKIAFGSCASQDKPQPILRQIIAKSPDLFVYLGDNIYGDTYELPVLRAKYELLARKPEFQALRAAIPTIATWDDHDYGDNDAGKDYPLKEDSKNLFLEFWLEPPNTERRSRPGIYTSYLFEGNGRRLQVILLDTRSFRDPLARNTVPSWKNDYHPDTDPAKTFLGHAQWTWLEAQLRVPADVRIIGTSIQFAHEHNGWESWTNLPHELLRMLGVIRRAGAAGVLFISGDVHWGELSILQPEGMYPLHDLTSSGLTETWDSLEPNQNRFGQAVRENNFGLIEIDWTQSDPLIALQLFDVGGRLRVIKQLRLSQLHPSAAPPKKKN